MKSHCLVGKTIVAIDIADDDLAIKFITTDGDIVARVDGDCCSSTWIEHVTLPIKFPALVIDVVNLDMPDSSIDEYYSVITYYGLRIVTTEGHIDIDYRNESNGYYGGNLSWPDDTYYYGGVCGQNVSSENWKPLTEDK